MAETIESLIRKLQNPNEDWHVRAGAIEDLSAAGDCRAVEPLIQILQQPDAKLRHRAAEALGMFSDARVVEPLMQALPGLRRRRALEIRGSTGQDQRHASGGSAGQGVEG